AEPTTFGLKVAGWYVEAGRNLERLGRAREVVAVGKLSGAVGQFAHVEPEVEEEVCRDLGLGVEPVSTQIVQRDRHAELVSTLAIFSSEAATIARDRKSTRLNSSHDQISYAVFCLKKKKNCRLSVTARR